MKFTLNRLCLVFSLVLIYSAHAVAEENSFPAGQSIAITISYNVCIDPEKPLCYVTKEADKNKCPNCKEWGSNYIGSETVIALAIKESEYSYDTGLKVPRANFLLRDASKKLYGVEYPKTNYGFPITVREIYENPEQYGWIEIDKNAQKTGALAVWPNTGGVVVKSATSVRKEVPQDIILYSSDKKRGNLNLIRAEKLGEGEPKFIIPKSILDAAVEARVQHLK